MLISIDLADERYCDGCMFLDRNEINNPMVKGPMCGLKHGPHYHEGHTLRPDACKEAEAMLRGKLDAEAVERLDHDLENIARVLDDSG